MLTLPAVSDLFNEFLYRLRMSVLSQWKALHMNHPCRTMFGKRFFYHSTQWSCIRWTVAFMLVVCADSSTWMLVIKSLQCL